MGRTSSKRRAILQIRRFVGLMVVGAGNSIYKFSRLLGSPMGGRIGRQRFTCEHRFTPCPGHPHEKHTLTHSLVECPLSVPSVAGTSDDDPIPSSGGIFTSTSRPSSVTVVSPVRIRYDFQRSKLTVSIPHLPLSPIVTQNNTSHMAPPPPTCTGTRGSTTGVTMRSFDLSRRLPVFLKTLDHSGVS